MKKRLIQFIAICFVMNFYFTNSYAYQQPKVNIEPIFTFEDGLWYPGRTENRNFTITNNIDKDIDLQTINISLNQSKNYETEELLDKDSKQFREMSENTTVKLMNKEDLIFDGKLSDLCTTEVIKLNKEISIKSYQDEEFNIVIDMDESMGNESQAIQNEFNVGVTYKINSDSITGGGNEGGNGGDNGGNTGSNEDKLPQTGGIVNSMSLVAIGAISVGVGVMLNKKTDKGEDCDE